MTNTPKELGRDFAEKNGFVGRKDAARDLRSHGIEATSETVAAWRAGAEPIVNANREAARGRRDEFVEEFAAEFLAELREEHPDWTREQLLEAAEPAAWEEHDRQREEAIAEAKARVAQMEEQLAKAQAQAEAALKALHEDRRKATS